jgi:two-component system response regulator MprA
VTRTQLREAPKSVTAGEHRTTRAQAPWRESQSAEAPDEILVVDDDPTVTRLLSRGLGIDGYAVRTALSGHQGLTMVRDRSPDLMILDRMMPRTDGLDVCRQVRQIDPSLPILMLTARGAPQDEVSGLEAGVDSYLAKPFSFELLRARIKALLRPRSETTNDGDTLAYADLMLDLLGRTAYRANRRVDLTTTEFNVLEFLLRHARHVLSKEQILEEIWGYDFEGTVNIVEVYIRLLRLKLEEFGEPRLIHTIRGAGYVLRDD